MDISKACRDQLTTALAASWNTKAAEKIPGNKLADISFTAGSKSFFTGNLTIQEINNNLGGKLPCIVLASTGAQNDEQRTIGRKKFNGHVTLRLTCFAEFSADKINQDFETVLDACEHALSEVLYAASWSSPVVGAELTAWNRAVIAEDGTAWAQAIDFDVTFLVSC